MGGFHDIGPCVEMVEDFFVFSGTRPHSNIRSGGIVPVSRYADRLDVGGLGPLLDAPSDEL